MNFRPSFSTGILAVALLASSGGTACSQIPRANSSQVSLKVTNTHGKPISNHEVWLTPTSSTKDIRPFGDFWKIEPSNFYGKTNAFGDVVIVGVPRGKPMGVITRFGPRFDPFVRAETNLDIEMDVMKLQGAVYPGRPAHVIIADDYQISGLVTNAETGAPMRGVEVHLCDNFFGHMLGYPLTTLDETKTNASGRYAFKRLPNCSFNVVLPSTGPSRAVESRVGSGPWDIRSSGNYSSASPILLNRSRTNCDFRISRLATLTVAVRKGTARSLGGWALWVGFHRSGFRDDFPDGNRCYLDRLAPPNREQEVTSQALIPGTYTVDLKPDYGATNKTFKVHLRPGERRRVVVTLSQKA